MCRNKKFNRLTQSYLLAFLPEIKNTIRKSEIALFVIVAIFSTTFVSLASPTGKTEKAGAKVGGSEVTVENFGKVTDFYYRGAQPKDEEYKQLAVLGVKTIVDLRDDAKDNARNQAENVGLKYINLPMSDKSYPAADASEKFLSIVADKANWPVYVHCAGGRHRTGAMTAVFRMNVQGWDADHAYGEMKDYDFYTRWGHKAMKKFVFDQYQALLRQKNESPKSQIAISASEAINR